MVSSEGESSVNTLTGTECNILYKTDDDDKEVVDKLDSTDRAERSVNTLTSTACNIVYETDEEEFVETVKVANINLTHFKKQKTKKLSKKSSSKSRNQEYHLSYLNLWWNRMLREANKEDKESRRKEKEHERREMSKKWFQPEPEQNRAEGYEESRRCENDDAWKLPQQYDKHLVREKSTEGGLMF